MLSIIRAASEWIPCLQVELASFSYVSGDLPIARWRRPSASGDLLRVARKSGRLRLRWVIRIRRNRSPSRLCVPRHAPSPARCFALPRNYQRSRQIQSGSRPAGRHYSCQGPTACKLTRVSLASPYTRPSLDDEQSCNMSKFKLFARGLRRRSTRVLVIRLMHALQPKHAWAWRHGHSFLVIVRFVRDIDTPHLNVLRFAKERSRIITILPVRSLLSNEFNVAHRFRLFFLTFWSCLDFAGDLRGLTVAMPLKYREGESATVLFQLHGDARFRQTVTGDLQNS